MAVTLSCWIIVVFAVLPFGKNQFVPPLPPVTNPSKPEVKPTTATPVAKPNNAGTTEFTVALYKQIAKMSTKTENILISPLSIYLSLAMLNVGADNESSKQIEKALNLAGAESDANEAMKNLIKLLKAENGNCHINNKIWQQKFFCFSHCRRFVDTLQRHYYAGLGEVNFAADPEKARAKINDWVNNSTNGKISELIAPKILTKDTRFVLTNAIYFQGAWKNPFIHEYTAPTRFTVMQHGMPIDKLIPTMYVKEKFRVDFGSRSSYKLVELPYKNERFSMVIVLPHEMSGLENLERTLTTEELQRIASNLQRRRALPLEVFLPKFKLSYGLELNKVLMGLGIKDIFNSAQADLSKITGFRGMYVSAITHKAFVKVNEFGTEASGATGTITDDFNLETVRVNRPFLFFILHKTTGTVVFLGRVTDPTQ